MKTALDIALRVFDSEMDALSSIKAMLAYGSSKFQNIIDEIMACKGKVVITGMGKSGHVAQKMAASMASLGTPAFCLHPGEAMHGDLGMLQADDLVIAISRSGESDEIVTILPNINRIGAKLIGITSNAGSMLAKSSYLCEVFPAFKEACLFDLAPTSSTTAALVYGDALALAASELKNFGKSDYALRHPAGSLGKKLTLRVSDCMTNYGSEVNLRIGDMLSMAVAVFCGTSVNVVPVYDDARRFIGIFTADSLKNLISTGKNIYTDSISEHIDRDPAFVSPEDLALEALKMMMRENDGHDYIIVLDDDRAVGVLTRENIIKKGVYL
ncbi:MAG: KpsF/GutQ family sugar-phosphate isomerase [Eubacterium sp.]|jgi:arabinose-5-phosphate isomerase|nr:KpsF/GutQ family sugar-phosphate isomerase [Eubacterium sp.]